MKKNTATGISISVSLFFLLIALGLFEVAADEDSSRKTINAMSFNIRYDNPGDKENFFLFQHAF
jgi:hypothetical protein